MLVKTHGEIWAQLSLLKLIILSKLRFYYALPNLIIDLLKYFIWVVDLSLSLGIEILVWSDHMVAKARLMPLIDRMCAKFEAKTMHTNKLHEKHCCSWLQFSRLPFSKKETTPLSFFGNNCRCSDEEKSNASQVSNKAYYSFHSLIAVSFSYRGVREYQCHGCLYAYLQIAWLRHIAQLYAHCWITPVHQQYLLPSQRPAISSQIHSYRR